MKCKQCGAEISNDSQFCEYCGKSTKQKKYFTKQVDVRWCLLLSMLIATVAMRISEFSCDLRGFDNPNCTYLTFVFPMALFAFTLWYGIKKLVPISFVVIIGVLLVMNGKMLYETLYTHEVYTSVYDIGWTDNCLTYHRVELSGMYDYNLTDPEKEKEQLQMFANIIKQELSESGIDDSDVSYHKKYEYYPNSHSWGMDFGALFLLLVYLIYAFVAHKKNLRF